MSYNSGNAVNGIYSVNHDLNVNGLLTAESITAGGISVPNASIASLNLANNNPNIYTPITLKNTSLDFYGNISADWKVDLIGGTLNQSGQEGGLIIRNNKTSGGSLYLCDAGVLGERVFINTTTTSISTQQSNFNFNVNGLICQINATGPLFYQGLTSLTEGNFLSYNSAGYGEFYSLGVDIVGLNYKPMLLGKSVYIKSTTGTLALGTTNPNSRITDAPYLDISGSQLRPRITLSGTEFFTGANTSTAGVALLTGVNRPGNRQLWIGDSEFLTQNTTNNLIRFLPNTGFIDCIKTNGTTPNDLTLGHNGILIAATSGSVKVTTLEASNNVRVTTNATIGQFITNNNTNNRKIILYDTLGNDNQFYGLGINANTMRFNVDGDTASYKFYAGTNATSSNLIHTLAGTGDAKHTRDLQANCFFSNFYSQTFGNNVTAGTVTATNLGLSNNSGIYMYSFARADKNVDWSLVGILTWSGTAFKGHQTLQNNLMSFTSITGGNFNFNPSTALFGDTFTMYLTRISGSPVYTV